MERLQKAADDAKQQLDSKENIVKELSRDGSKLDKERYCSLYAPPCHCMASLHSPDWLLSQKHYTTSLTVF